MPAADRLIRSSLPASVRLADRPDALPYLEIATRAATAQVFFQGAHLARWRPAHTPEPVLWVSAHSHFRPGTAIRGGVPICFPWFAAHGSDPEAPSHGFVRVADWALTDASEALDGTVALAFTLDIEPQTSRWWPHRCRLGYRLSIGATLAMALDVTNPGDAAFSCEEALHSYYAVGDITRVAVSGLEGAEYLDKVQDFARVRQGQEPVRFAGETDRVYPETTATCRIADAAWNRTLVVRKAESRSTVVWNPWEDRARAFADFGDDEWQAMVCVESANVRADAVTLAPGESHTLRVDVSIE